MPAGADGSPSRSQSGHLSLNPNPVHAVEAYTKASEGWGIPEAQYKLGFLYGSNFANATGPLEGVGEQGSVRHHLSVKSNSTAHHIQPLTNRSSEHRRSCTTPSQGCRSMCRRR